MRFLSHLAALLFAALLSACGGGGGSPGQTAGVSQALFTTAPAALTLMVGAAQEFSLAGGRSPYSAVSNNAAIAVAGVSENKLALGAVTPGNAQITIRDSAGATSTVDITVTAQRLFTTAPGSITIAPGAGGAQTYKVGGAAPQTATSSNVNVVTASLSGENLVVTGVTAGSAEIVVRDNFGATISIPVVVTAASNLPLFTTATPSVTISVASPATYTVGGGATPYVATSSNTNVATVAMSAGSLTITGVSAGSAVVQVRDASGSVLSIAVTIGGGTLTVNPSAATALIGDVLLAKITGGRAPYTAVVTNTSVADAFVSANGTLQVNVKQQAASVPVLITDADGLSTTFTITSSPGQSAILLSPTALTVTELTNESIVLQVYGATGAITAFSSDTSLLSAFASGNTVTVSTGSRGNRCVSGDAQVTISVVDSKSALATSVITIKNSTSLTCP